jgi:hypothetical protein
MRRRFVLGAPSFVLMLREAHGFCGFTSRKTTRQGGGVAEILSSLTPLMNDVEITTEWLIIDHC